MIDPTTITKYDRTDAELQELLLFTVAVAGKTAKTIAQKLDGFLKLDRSDGSPFEKIRRMADSYCLGTNLQEVRMGRYSVLGPCYRALATSGINLRTCSLEELETFPGIGPKTSRFFVLHSRPKQRIAVLDTHLLSYLGELGYDVPKTTPSGKKYFEIERIFIEHADFLNRDIAELDLFVWNQRSARSGRRETVLSSDEDGR